MAILGQAMLHLPVPHKMMATAIVGMALTLVLSWLSFRYFEAPFIRLKYRLVD
jgi:peptidoglycan/LPS O-acetylase OafA/YrhL